MKKIILINMITFLLLANGVFGQEDFRKQAPKAGPAPRIELGKAEQFTLKNGLKVILVENHKLPRVSFQVFVDVPPFMENDAVGYAELAGALLTKGTATRSKAQIDEAVDFIGASLNSSANGVNGTSLTRHKEKLLEIMADVILNPAFPQEEFDKVKKQSLSALASDRDDPNQIASNVSAVLRNGKTHPSGEIKTEASLNKATVEMSKKFYDTYFKPNISYLVVTGDIKMDELKKLANKYFSDWKKGDVAKTTFPTPQKPAAAQVAFVDKAGAVQSAVRITYPVDLKPGADDAIKASVMNTLLGSYFSSRLNANLREDKAYTYGAGSSLSPNLHIGSFTASASVRNEVTDSAIVQFLLELDKLRTEEVTDKELDMVKNVMTGNFARSLESPETVANFTLNTVRYNLPADYYSTYLEKLSKVTKADVLAMAKKYITPDNAYILVVGNKDDVSKKLAVFGDGKTRFYNHFGDPIENVAMVIPDGVTAETVLSDYLTALGGVQKLNTIKALEIKTEALVQGMTIETVVSHKAPDKLSTTTSMMGNVMQSIVFDGEKGQTSQMGQAKPFTPEELADTKVDAHLIPERSYKELGVKTELSGVEMIEGKKAWKLSVVYPSGAKKTHYFDVETSLKIREIDVEGETVLTKDISDYKEVDGIKFPHTMSISGAAPFLLKMETKSLVVNGEIADSVFEVR